MEMITDIKLKLLQYPARDGLYIRVDEGAESNILPLSLLIYGPLLCECIWTTHAHCLGANKHEA